MTFDLHNVDCLEFMRSMPDKSVDAVITDPPYGLGGRTTGGSSKNTQSRFDPHAWDDAPPNKEVFDQLRKIGDCQIFWGGNYFELPPTRCVLVWDKMTYIPTMSRVEIAWTSFDYPAKYIMLNSNLNNREHATQKPVALLKWCIEICKLPQGSTIFDPFMGSGTTGIACMELGYNFIGCEIDPNYYAIAERRIKQAAMQEVMFT